MFLETWKKITDTNLKAQYYESLLEYWLDGTLPSNPIIDALLTSAMYSIDKTDEVSERKSEYMKGNSNATKSRDKLGNHIKTEKNREEQKQTEKNTWRIKKNIEEYRSNKEDKEDNKKEKINKKKFLDFVLLSDDEHEKLVKQLWVSQTNELIDKLNNYIGSTWKRYKSHYFTILNRAKKEQPHSNHQQEMMKERERQRIREEAQEILNHNTNTNGTTIQETTYNRRTDLQSG